MRPDDDTLPSDKSSLTLEQHAFWARRGFLVLKDFFDAGELDVIRSLGKSGRESQEGAGARQLNDLVRRLSEPVSLLIEDEPVCVRLGASRPALSIGRDSWRKMHDVVRHGVTATVAVRSSNDAAREILFYPESQLIPAGSATANPRGVTDIRSETAHVVKEIRQRGLSRQTLGYAAGDVWLRHADLVWGAIATSTNNSHPSGTEILFGRRQDLPKDATRLGLAALAQPLRPQSFEGEVASRSETSSGQPTKDWLPA